MSKNLTIQFNYDINILKGIFSCEKCIKMTFLFLEIESETASEYENETEDNTPIATI